MRHRSCVGRTLDAGRGGRGVRTIAKQIRLRRYSRFAKPLIYRRAVSRAIPGPHTLSCIPSSFVFMLSLSVTRSSILLAPRLDVSQLLLQRMRLYPHTN